MIDKDDDDLDELLDEVEKKFCRNVAVTSPAVVTSSSDAGKCVKKEDEEGRGKRSATKPAQPISSITEDIDALLEELLDDDLSDHPQQKTEQFPKATQKPSSQSGGRKCCPVFVGGSSAPNGVGTATSKRCCDQLRCTSCDFRVLMFDDCEWDSTCDYLFLRNNMPDRQKLRAKLKRRRGFRAYACQCSWMSSSEAADLRDRDQLRWRFQKDRKKSEIKSWKRKLKQRRQQDMIRRIHLERASGRRERAVYILFLQHGAQSDHLRALINLLPSVSCSPPSSSPHPVQRHVALNSFPSLGQGFSAGGRGPKRGLRLGFQS